MNKRAERYENFYSKMKPYVEVIYDNDSFKMILSASEGIQYDKPQFGIKYERMQYLQPWYPDLDSASTKFDRIFRITTNLIDISYGKGDTVEAEDTTKCLFLEIFNADTSFSLSIKGENNLVEYRRNSHWTIKNPTWTVGIDQLEFKILENKQDSYRYEKTITKEGVSYIQDVTYSRRGTIFLMSRLIQKQRSSSDSSDEILNMVTFTDYRIRKNP